MPGFAGTDRDLSIRVVVGYPIAMLRRGPECRYRTVWRIYALLIGPQF